MANAKHMSGKWSAVDDREMIVSISGSAESTSEIAYALRCLANVVEGIATEEQRLHVTSENAPLSMTIESEECDV